MSRWTVISPVTEPLGRVLRVLVADPAEDRLKGFRVEGENNLVTYANTLRDFVQALDEDTFDLVFTAGFYESPKAQLSDITSVLRVAHLRGRFRVAVVTLASVYDGEKVMKELKLAEVPSIYFPFNWAQPQNHVEWKKRC